MIATFELALPQDSLIRGAPASASVTHPALPQDEALAIARTIKGDVHAFDELVRKYQQIAYSVAYRTLQSSELAADAVQDSFMKAFRALPTFRGVSFKNWLIRIVINTCYDFIRVERRLPTALLDDEPVADDNGVSAYQSVDPHESPVDFVERRELRERIELGLLSLPVEQRTVLVLADIHGFSYQEISEITRVNTGTVKSRISRARLRMRDFLLQKPDLL